MRPSLSISRKKLSDLARRETVLVVTKRISTLAVVGGPQRPKTLLVGSFEVGEGAKRVGALKA